MSTREKTKINEKAQYIIKRNKRQKWIVIAILIGFVTVIGCVFVNIYQQQERLLRIKSEQNELLAQKVAHEQATKKELANTRENLDSPEIIEKMAREKFDMVRPGERVFVDINH